MLRRTKMLIVGYCIGGLAILALAVGIALQFTDWFRHPEQFEKLGHHHAHEEEVKPPETSPAETYVRDGNPYLKSPFLKKDFDVTQSSVDLGEILLVNLNPESFPELAELQSVPAQEAAIPDEDGVLGVSVEGESRAYPVRMLNYHVVLNDVCAGREIAIVWDPLTMTAKVFDRGVRGSDGPQQALTFHNLGLIYKGGLLLCDGDTGSVWWPPEGRCIAGKLNGTTLGDRAFLLVSWKVWKERHPVTTILSLDTPFRGKYAAQNPYDAYYGMQELPLPAEGWGGKESPFRWSEPVIALERNGKAKVYPFSVIGKVQGGIEDTFAGQKVVIKRPEPGPPYPTDEQGGEIRYSFGAWFLWTVRYPEVEVYRAEKPKNGKPGTGSR